MSRRTSGFAFINGILEYRYDASHSKHWLSISASSTGLFLQDVGMYDRAVDAFHFTVDSFETSREIAEHYLPIYINHTRENLGPALTKAAHQAQWAWTQAAATGSDALQKVIFSPLNFKG